ncbi:hypothetical protein [Dactylosporangium sp. CS-033363]|uniref:hypothetical protein n=1 Tax=Dactylosporangium sp. CS-033363 TaxID=3239935 RepID=UPI003D89EA22
MTEADTTRVRDLVDQAIRAAVPPDQAADRWSKLAPAAGLAGALAVVEAAQRQAYQYVLKLRGEGTSWEQAADLLGIGWSDDYVRRERAYELVLGPDPDGDRPRYNRNVYWHCGGPVGCGKYITDHGPYDGNPADTEAGHAHGCGRHANEVAAYHRASELREEQDRVADEAMERLKLEEDRFGVETAARARWVVSHGGQYQGWSTSETLAVALVLADDKQLAVQGWSREEATRRVFQGTRPPADGPASWLARVRAAATGEMTA